MKLLKFSENLKEALRVNHITQLELAKKLDTTQQTISRWLKGINEPDLETFLEICLYLNETPNSLLGYEDIPNRVKATYITAPNNSGVIVGGNNSGSITLKK